MRRGNFPFLLLWIRRCLRGIPLRDSFCENLLLWKSGECCKILTKFNHKCWSPSPLHILHKSKLFDNKSLSSFVGTDLYVLRKWINRLFWTWALVKHLSFFLSFIQFFDNVTLFEFDYLMCMQISEPPICLLNIAAVGKYRISWKIECDYYEPCRSFGFCIPFGLICSMWIGILDTRLRSLEVHSFSVYVAAFEMFWIIYWFGNYEFCKYRFV